MPLRGQVWTVAETQDQMRQLEELLTRGATMSQLITYARRPRDEGGLGIGTTRTRKLARRIQARWDEEDRDLTKSRKAAQTRRLYRWMRDAAGIPDPNNPNAWLRKPNLQALARLEELYADLHGTRAPQVVVHDVRVSETLVGVIAELDADQVADLLARRHEDQALAEAYRAQQGNVLPPYVNGNGAAH